MRKTLFNFGIVAYADGYVIKRPKLTFFRLNIPYFSQAKSHNFEPTNNTIVKYKFASYSM